jgi:hypothetical protein
VYANRVAVLFFIVFSKAVYSIRLLYYNKMTLSSTHITDSQTPIYSIRKCSRIDTIRAIKPIRLSRCISVILGARLETGFEGGFAWEIFLENFLTSRSGRLGEVRLGSVEIRSRTVRGIDRFGIQ